MQYALYNVWANKRIIEVLYALAEKQVDLEIISSFPSLRKTVYHTWSAEDIWLQRLQQVTEPVWLAGSYTGTFSEACDCWGRCSEAFAELLDRHADDNSLKEVIHYLDLKKNLHSTPVFDILHHVFNHSTYHRGQIVSILRQLGVQEIPGTDFIGYIRMN